jgi:hypothetical protein
MTSCDYSAEYFAGTVWVAQPQEPAAYEVDLPPEQPVGFGLMAGLKKVAGLLEGKLGLALSFVPVFVWTFLVGYDESSQPHRGFAGQCLWFDLKRRHSAGAG